MWGFGVFLFKSKIQKSFKSKNLKITQSDVLGMRVKMAVQRLQMV